jgi:hypothetical protein
VKECVTTVTLFFINAAKACYSCIRKRSCVIISTHSLFTVHHLFRTERERALISPEKKQNEIKKRDGIAGPRNHENVEPLNTSHIGRSLTVTLINGRIESGILRKLGAYMLEIETPQKRSFIVNKGSIMVVSLL